MPGRLPPVSIGMLIPNAVTLASLCAGLTAIRYATLEKWEHVVIALFVAGVCDTLDGRLARMLKSQSQFGAELDSLADVVSFGVAPAIVLYLWTLSDAGPLGWVAVLCFACCSALRLARFNVATTDVSKPAFTVNFFTGVPTPAGAGLAVLPLVLSLGLSENNLGTLAEHDWFIIPWTLLIAGLMVSQLPTYSFKKMKFSRDIAVFVLFGLVLLGALLITKPWVAMALILGAYLSTLPLSWWHYRKLAKTEAKV
jgi:CDP-diacylglycerol---serine O-phosphatidyltransferase